MTYGAGQDYDLKSYAESYYQAGFPYEKMIGGVESEFGYAEMGDMIHRLQYKKKPFL